MRILDLFCGAGGAAMGYHQAFPDADIIGIDLKEQHDYPFEFRRGDAMRIAEEWAGIFDLIHASPPCQSYSTMSNRHGSEQPELITKLRSWLEDSGVPYIIENVEGAKAGMVNPVTMCGTMFGLPTRRHRLFETSFDVLPLLCGPHTRDLIPVYGRPDGRLLWTRKDGSEYRAWASIEEGQRALGIDWTDDWHQLREAIPPAYTRYIATNALIPTGS